jgi:predicted enzyme related to lactoylglutathione lyase
MAKPNPVVHFEMSAKDRERVSKFYDEAFGWKMVQMGEEVGKYVVAQTTETDDEGMVKTPGNINGGFFFQDEKDEYQPPHVVISVDNLEESIKAVTDAGGKKVGEQMDIPGIGLYQGIEDTEGNNVGVLEPSRS